MRYFPHILRTVRMGRTRVLPIRPVLRDARNLPAPIVSVIIGLPLPVFATACILLPVACPPLQPARRSSLPAACSACSACSATCPLLCHLPAALPALPALPAARRLLQPAPACSSLLCRSSQPVCKKSETFQSLAFLLSGLGLRQAPPRLSALQSRKPSRTSCSRILAQSATGCFSPSTNRSGHPRLQSSM